MRTVFLNGDVVCIDTSCGFRPVIHKCPVKKFVANLGMPYQTVFVDLFDSEIYVQCPNCNSAAIAEQIRNICDNCKYGVPNRTRSKTR